MHKRSKRYTHNDKIDEVDGRADQASKRLSVLEGKMVDMEEGYNELLALGWEQTATLIQACRAIAALSTIMTAQQDQVTVMRERMVWAEDTGGRGGVIQGVN